MQPISFANLSGRYAVVTGASSGIGWAIAQEFAAAGASVLLHYAHAGRDEEMKRTISQWQANGRSVISLRVPFQADTDYSAFVEQCQTALSPKIDIWVNNAGVDLLTGTASELSYDQKLDKLLAIDVRSTMLLTKCVAAKMQAQGQGVILNIGWDQADRGMEGDSAELFSAAKNAIMGATRSFAVSYAPEVRVNCIAPGWIQTAWGKNASTVWQDRVLRETPLRRWGQPEDIAKLARFLVSDEASFLTGQTYNVNGGAVR